MGKHLTRPARQPPSMEIVDELLEKVRSVGGDVENLLRRSGLAGARNGGSRRSCNRRLTSQEFTRLYAECTWLLNDHTSGLSGHAPITKAEMDLLCYCVINCSTLKEVIARAAQFTAAVGPRAAALILQVTDGVAEFRMHTGHRRRLGDRADIGALLTDLSGLSMHHRLFSWLIGEDVDIIDAGISHPKLISDDLAMALMPHPLTFDASDNLIRFPAAYLDRAVLRTYAELVRVLEWFAFDLEEDRSIATPLRERIRTVLVTTLTRGAPLPTARECADRFSISLATLKRRLAEEGATLGELKAAARRETAERLLGEGRHPVSEVAARVGFCDARSFRRAFVGWTGQTPSKFMMERARSGLRSPSER